MKITPIHLIASVFFTFFACKLVFFVDVKDEVKSQLNEAFPDEFAINFDAAHFNLLTKRITVKGVEFPSTGTTVDRLSFTNLADMDTLPDSVSFSASGVKGFSALLAKQFPDIDWSNMTAALTKDGVKEGDEDAEFSIRVARNGNDAVISTFFGMAYVHNFTLKVTLGDVHSIINGGFGRLVRAKRLNGDSDGVFAGVVDIVKGLPESRGMNVDVLQIDFSHTVVGTNSAYESLALINQGSDVDLFFDAMYQHRKFGSLDSGTAHLLTDTPFSLYDYMRKSEDNKVLFIQSLKQIDK